MAITIEVGINPQVKNMADKPVSEPKTSRYQVVASMTPDELLSEGYANFDDFYDPEEEKEKEAIAEETRKAAQIPWRDDGEQF